MIKKLFCILVAAAPLFLCGCSGATIYTQGQNLEDLELVLTMGVDAAEAGVAVSADTGLGQNGQPSRIYTRSAESMASALNLLQRSAAGKDSYFDHLESVLLGQGVAEGGIRGCLDYVERSMEMRMNVNLFVVRGGTALELFEQCSGGEGSAASEMLRRVAENLPKQGLGRPVTCMDFASALSQRGCGLIAAVTTHDGDEISDGKPLPMVAPAGYAMFVGDKLCGWLDKDESCGAAALMRQLEYADETVFLQGGYVSLAVTGAKPEYQPVFDGGELTRLDVALHITADVLEISGDIDLRDEAVRSVIGEQAAEMYRSRAKAAVQAAQELGWDVMGLGGMTEQAGPDAYRKMKTPWEEVFPQLEINITAQAELARSFDLTDPLPLNGEEKAK